MLQFDKMFEEGQPMPTLREMTDGYAAFILAKNNGKKTKAARVLGINRRTLYRRKNRQGADCGEEPGGAEGS